MGDFIFLLFDVEEMMEGGVDVERSHETFLRVELQGCYLGRIFVDEPLGKPEAKHRLPLLDFALFGIPAGRGGGKGKKE